MRHVALAAALGALAAASLAATADGLVAAWHERAAASASRRDRAAAAISVLERRGDGTGVAALMRLARSRVPLAGADETGWAILVPPDTVGDLALDSLRRMRTGDAARCFEWDAGSGCSHDEALEAFRRAELAEAESWWEARQTP